MASYVEQNLSIDAVGEWKPAPEVYRYAAEVTGTPLTRVASPSYRRTPTTAMARGGLACARAR
jgi:hypothetical protein